MKSTLLGALAAALLFSCTPGAPVPPPGDVAASDKQRLTTPAPAADLIATVQGNTGFAFDLYRKAAGTGNLIFSPHSIEVALAMTYGGARNATATAFEQTMKIGLPAPQFHAAMNDLDQQLNSRGQNASGENGTPFRLAVTNQLFAQKGFTLLSTYLDLLAQDYGSNARLMDFKENAEPSRVKINAWVASETEQKITDLLAPGTITSDTRLVLVNAIYFNAAWAQPFEKNATADAPFTQLDGSTSKVPTMRSGEFHGRAATIGTTEVVELPYSGNELSMLVMMPAAGDLAAFEAGLDAKKLEGIVGALKSESLDLSMPRFTIRTALPLGETLRSLGLSNAFSSDADFSGMTGDRSLSITDVIHQAFIAVDEAGTEAAAATAVVVGVTSISQPGRALKLDHPFVFAIRDLKTGAVVFGGRVTKI